MQSSQRMALWPPHSRGHLPPLVLRVPRDYPRSAVAAKVEGGAAFVAHGMADKAGWAASASYAAPPSTQHAGAARLFHEAVGATQQPMSLSALCWLWRQHAGCN